MSPRYLEGEGVKLSSAQQNTGNMFLNQLTKMFPNQQTNPNKDEESTSIPYYGTVVGDLLYNPSSVSISTFQRMLYTDDVIGLCLEYLSSNIESRIGLYTHPNSEIQESVRKMFKRKLKGGQKQLIKQMNSRNWAGFYMGQMIWRYDIEDGMSYCVRVRPMPPATVQVRVDHAGEILQGKGDLGVLQFQFNYIPGLTNGFNSLSGGYPNAVNTMNSSGQLMGYLNGCAWGSYNDPLSEAGDADFPIRSFFIPPYIPVGMRYQTFLHSVYDIGDGFSNPYGRSILRRVHSLYVLKWAIIQLGLIALDRRGQPLLALYADAQKTITDPVTKEEYSAVDIGAAIAPQIHATSLVVLPGRKEEIFELEAIKSEANLDVFNDMLKMLNGQIKDTLFTPSALLGSGESGGSSYASVTAHGGMFDRFVKSRCEEICEDILTQLVQKFLEYNFDESEWEGTLGEFKYNSLSLDEQLKEAKLAETLAAINFVSDQKLEDINKVRESTGFDRVDKCFEPMVDELGENGTPGTNIREAKGVYKHEPLENM